MLFCNVLRDKIDVQTVGAFVTYYVTNGIFAASVGMPGERGFLKNTTRGTIPRGAPRHGCQASIQVETEGQQSG
jgi:hypothetical protein